MKRINLFQLLLPLLFLLACEKDDDIDGATNDGTALKITATNVIDGNIKITTVKALAYWESGDEDYVSDAIAQASYQNNGFTLELPATLGTKYLGTLDGDDLERISVSDRNYKLNFLDDLSGYNEDEAEFGYFFLGEENEDSQHYTSWIYVDRDVTIKGEYNETDEEYNVKYINIIDIDVTLKKGWNLVYDSYTNSYENGRYVSYTLSSNKPSGVNYTWNFYVYDDSYSSASVALKSARNSKLISSKLKGNKKK